MSNENISTHISNQRPTCPTYFKKRVCVEYVDNPKNHSCAGCLKDEDAHQRKSENTKWNYKECTVLEPTDAYGMLRFPGSHTKSANYIKVELETNTSDMIEYLYNQEGWNLQPPKLIISVTGGAQKFTIPPRMKKAFKRGLIKAAASTGAWIITGGTNAGVMRLVGEAVADEFHKKSAELTVLGIATWGKVALRDKMIVPDCSFDGDQQPEKDQELFYAIGEEEPDRQNGRRVSVTATNDILLDPNHTHFILVDDGSENQFGKEIEFRASLENELRKGKSLSYYKNKRSRRSFNGERMLAENTSESEDDHDADGVPMVLIVVQGGPNTLKTVKESLEHKVPVLVLADSKGCADQIANALALPIKNDENLRNVVEESKMFEKQRGTPAFEKQVNDAVSTLKYIIKRADESLVHVFKLDSEEGGQDIELTILRVFLTSRKNQDFENLKLALQWNRDDIAKNYIFTGEEEFKSHQLSFLMEQALVQNKPKFVELLLENGLNLKSFLTIQRLIYLYNSAKIKQSAKKAPLYQLYKKKYLPAKNNTLITFDGIKKFLTDYLFDDFKPEFLKDLENLDVKQMSIYMSHANEKGSSMVSWRGFDKNRFRNQVTYPEKNLFVWALLLNRIEIAQIFWQIGEHQICTALFASNLLKSISNHLNDLKDELETNAIEFENMACGVMEIFDTSSNDAINGIVLLQKIPYYSIDCLQMAFEAKCMSFIAMPCVQNLLTDIWNGKIEIKSGLRGMLKFLMSCSSYGLLAPFLMFDNKGKLLKRSNTQMLNGLNRTASTKNKKLKVANTVLKDYFIDEQEEVYEKIVQRKQVETDDDHNCINALCCCCVATNEADGNAGGDGADADGDNDHEQEETAFGNEDDAENENEINLTVMSASPRAFDVHQQTTPWQLMRKNFHLYHKRYTSFINSPRVCFIYETFFYTIFLVIFSYMLLCNFEYYVRNDPNADDVAVFNESKLVENKYLPFNNHTDFNSTTSFEHLNSTDDALEAKSAVVVSGTRRIAAVSLCEYILYFWILTFIAEEIRQFIFGDTDKKLSSKIFRYFDDKWNYLDLSGCILFVIGYILRIISLFTNEKVFIAARLVFAIDLLLWYLRLLHVSIVFKSLGPKLVMIQKMLVDLLFFIIIIIIFVCSFGITTQATLYPGNELSVDLIKNLINKAYWPIYGDMKILEEINEENEVCLKDSDNPECPTKSGVYYSFVALMIYMVIANVLLINLLIAMFSATFQSVQDNTDRIWKFQRYRLVFEYFDASAFPPPISIIGYVLSFLRYVKRKNFTSGGDHEAVKTDDDEEDEPFFERKYAEEYLRNKKISERETVDSRLRYNNEKLEYLEQRLNEIAEARFKDTHATGNAINWLMTQYDPDNEKAPYIK